MLTEKELQILKHLRQNSRATVTEIGKKVGLPRSTVYDKIKKFKKQGIVSKYTSLINFHELGHPICTKILFKATDTDRQKLGEALASSSHTNNVVKLGNEYDYLASFVFPSMDNFHSYLDILTTKYSLRDYKIFYIAKELKREGFLH